MLRFLAALKHAIEVEPQVFEYLIERGWYFTMQQPIQHIIWIESFRKANDHSSTDAVMSSFAKGLNDINVTIKSKKLSIYNIINFCVP